MDFIKKNYKALLIGVMVVLAIIGEILIINKEGLNQLRYAILMFLCVYLGALIVTIDVEYHSFIGLEVKNNEIRCYVGKQYNQETDKDIALESLLTIMLEIYSEIDDAEDFIVYVLRTANKIENLESDYVIDHRSIKLKENVKNELSNRTKK